MHNNLKKDLLWYVKPIREKNLVGNISGMYSSFVLPFPIIIM